MKYIFETENIFCFNLHILKIYLNMYFRGRKNIFIYKNIFQGARKYISNLTVDNANVRGRKPCEQNYPLCLKNFKHLQKNMNLHIFSTLTLCSHIFPKNTDLCNHGTSQMCVLVYYLLISSFIYLFI